MTLMRSKVEASHVDAARGFSRAIGPGQVVNVDEILGAGVRVRDVFPLEWFEEMPADEAEER